MISREKEIVFQDNENWCLNETYCYMSPMKEGIG